MSVTDEGGAVAFSEDVGLATEATAFGLPLVDGIVYTIAVTATNGAGLVSAPVTTEHVLDRSPPVAGAVRDGSSLVADIDYQGTQQVAFNWDAFTEPHTAVTYTVKICEVLAAPEVCVVATPVGNATSFSGTGLPLEPRVSYFVHITGTNGAGASDSASSDGEAAAAVAVAFRRLTPSHTTTYQALSSTAATPWLESCVTACWSVTCSCRALGTLAPTGTRGSMRRAPSNATSGVSARQWAWMTFSLAQQWYVDTEVGQSLRLG